MEKKNTIGEKSSLDISDYFIILLIQGWNLTINEGCQHVAIQSEQLVGIVLITAMLIK